MNDGYLPVFSLLSMTIIYRACSMVGTFSLLIPMVPEKALNGRPEDNVLLQTIPNVNDALWMKEIYRAPKDTFSSIYRFLLERKVLLRKASCIENVIEKRDTCLLGMHSQGNMNLDSGISESVYYTCTLDKAFRFYKMAMFDTIPCQVY